MIHYLLSVSDILGYTKVSVTKQEQLGTGSNDTVAFSANGLKMTHFVEIFNVLQNINSFLSLGKEENKYQVVSTLFGFIL